MRITLTAVALFCSAILYAQADTFQIKNYKYRTPGFRALQLNLNMFGQFNSLTDNNKRKLSSRSLQLGPMDASYFRTRSTDRLLSNNSYNLSIVGSLGSSSVDGRTSKQNAFGTSATWVTNNQFFRRNNWFFEVRNWLTGNITRAKSGDTSYTNCANSQFVSNHLTIGFGKGRIELVQDAQTALFILNDLQQQGLINGNIPSETAHAFARLITDINNSRVFDSRKRRIYELTRIDSFIKNSGLSTTTDIRHFTTINDNWAFAMNPFRTSGTQWFVRLTPFASYNAINSQTVVFRSESENSNSIFSHGIMPEIGFNRSKPISLKWQKNYGLSGSYQLVRTKYKQSSKFNGTVVQTPDSVLETKSISAIVFYSIGYYPNNRTNIETSFTTGASRIEYDHLPSETFVNYNASLAVTARYFIGYRTYLNGIYQLSYNSALPEAGNSFVTNTKVWNSYLHLNLTHFIF